MLLKALWFVFGSAAYINNIDVNKTTQWQLKTKQTKKRFISFGKPLII